MLLLLILAVLVPGACLLWFMNEAMNNERLAVRQRLSELYRATLDEQSRLIDTFWQRKADALQQHYVDEAAGERFARLVEAGIADAVILFDETGRVIYPIEARPPPQAHEPAAEVRNQVRAQVQSDDVNQAIAAVLRMQTDPGMRDAQDSHGRLVLPDIQLLVLQAQVRKGDPLDPDIHRSLDLRIRGYREDLLPSRQRQFLMAQLQVLDPALAFPTLDAERLAEDVLQEEPLPERWPELRPRTSGNWWFLPSLDSSVIGIYRHETIARDMQVVLDRQSSLPGVASVRLLTPGDPGAGHAFLSEPAGRFLPGFALGLFLDASDPFAAEADRKIGTYLWIGLLTIAVVAVLAMLMAGVLFRQIRLTRLKNDFVATVSHELKTPLSSMRVLVDTLLEGRVRDEDQGRRYLELIARENERLSRLIDNFLSFSRMERDKQAFEFTRVSPAELVHTAADVLQERFEAAEGSLDLDIAPSLPPILADRDAMVTVLLNLLDNAYKYSGDDKRVHLETSLDHGQVCFTVKDHGMGLSRRDARKILDRFYQVDQRLSRKAGGCGLGLSIVKFIVDAHHGTVDIQSRVGEGSTFRVRVPVASNRPAHDHPAEGEGNG